jgi:hypothetical protein
MASRPLCIIPGCDFHYACKLRNKGMQVSPRAQMSRTQNWRPTPSVPPAYNKQLMYDTRPDGSKMPILTATGDHLRRREYDEKRHQIDATIRRIRNQQPAKD